MIQKPSSTIERIFNHKPFKQISSHQKSTIESTTKILKMLNTSRITILNIALCAALIDAFAPSLPAEKSFRGSISLDMVKKVFIDGEAGTTGLQVRDRLSKRDDLEIISAPFELRKDEETRKKLINEADAVILCKFLSNFIFLHFHVYSDNHISHHPNMGSSLN